MQARHVLRIYGGHFSPPPGDVPVERKLTDLIDKALSRRTFLAGAGATAAGTVLAGCSGVSAANAPTPTAPVTSPAVTLTDADYLNFALNLEYLEAEFYLHAATGTGLSATDTGNATSKTVVPASTQLMGLTAVQSAYLNEVAQNELDHVRFLRSALGSAAVAAPAIDLVNSFNTLASVANTATPSANVGTTFNPFMDYTHYLLGAFIFEDVGVTAYHGAAIYLTNSGNLLAAAQIHAVEAYHAASIRAQIVVAGAPYVAIANAIEAVRGTLGGGQETTLSATSIVAASASNSVGFSRTTDQVLHIVYGTGGGAGVKSGVFFPNGLNGNISVTAS